MRGQSVALGCILVHHGVRAPITSARWREGTALCPASVRETTRRARAIASTLSTSGHVHESVHVDDPTDTTRDWFAWGDAALCELLLDLPAHR